MRPEERKRGAAARPRDEIDLLDGVPLSRRAFVRRLAVGAFTLPMITSYGAAEALASPASSPVSPVSPGSSGYPCYPGSPGYPGYAGCQPDDVPPVLHVPANITVEAAGPGGAAVVFSVTATDAVDGETPVVCTPASGSTFPLGVTTVTCSSTDAAGNTATATFTVTVQDTTAPTVSAQLERVGARPSGLDAFRVEVQASDAVGVARLAITLNGVPVRNGQIVELRPSERHDHRVEWRRRLLAIEAPSFLLEATAADAAGNTATATAVPVFAPRPPHSPHPSHGHHRHHGGGHKRPR